MGAVVPSNASTNLGIWFHPTHKSDPLYGEQRYRHRNVIERFFRALRNFCRVATRYDKLPENFPGFTWLAALNIHLR